MPTDTENSPHDDTGLYQTWNSRIRDALKREEKYRKSAQKVVDLYEAKDADNTPFALVYSNTETLLPAVYNARPIPIVTRRYKDADPLGKATAEVSTRLLKYLIEAESANYDSFDELMQPAVLDALITNRGLTRFKFVASAETSAECVYGESVRWDKFLHGYARTWKKVPWIAFEWDMSEEEFRQNFPDLPFDFAKGNDQDDTPTTGESREQLAGVKTFKAYEIWDKSSGTVFFISACYPKGPLRKVPDPLKLSGFFPIPKPLNFMRKVTTLVPTPLYEHYRQQAQELNDITVRLKAIIRAIKYRGAYNSAVEGIDKMLQADENVLVPVENVQSMPDGMGMDKLLWIVPVQELAQTAQSLYQQRESVKQVIYEITGISDILRGASVASETATAQNIKNQWGTLRLKKMQKEVQRYCRDSLSIVLEIAAGNFELPTIQQMTGLGLMTKEQKLQVQTSMQQQALQQQQQALIAQQTGQQPQAPQQPEIPLEIQHAMMQPTWDDVMGLLRNDIQLHYKTDIETNSTIDAEASQDKQDIAELLNALSQFFTGIGPLVQQGTLPFAIAKEMLLVVTRRYNFGSQLEDALIGMQEPPKQDPNNDPAKQAQAQADIAKAKFDMQAAQQDAQISQQEFQQKMELMKMELQISQQELEIKRQELTMQQQALGMKLQVQTVQHQQKLAQIQAKSQADSAKEEKSEGENATV